MATCIDAVATTASTSNTTSYASASFTPALNDLLVVFVTASATVASAPTITDSLGAVTFTLVATCLKNSSADSIYCFVANQLAAASARTLTFNCSQDSATGCVIHICRVSGMTRTGSSAVRQSKTQPNAAAGTPAPVFASSCLTGNPTLGVVGNSTSPATMTPPTGWTEREDQGYSTPTTGAEYVTRDSGFTGTTVTWGSASASAFGAIIIELDTSVPPSPIAATIAGSSSLSGTLTGKGALATNIAGAAGASMAVKGTGRLAAVIAGAGSFSATPAGTGRLAATIAGVGALSGTVRGAGRLAATIAGAATVSANLTSQGGNLAATIAGHSTLSGTLTGVGRMRLVATGSSSLSASLVGVAHLAMAAAGTATLSASLRAFGKLAAIMSGSGGLTGSFPQANSDPRKWTGYSLNRHHIGCGPRPSPWYAGIHLGMAHSTLTGLIEPPTFWPYHRPTVGQRVRLRVAGAMRSLVGKKSS